MVRAVLCVYFCLYRGLGPIYQILNKSKCSRGNNQQFCTHTPHIKGTSKKAAPIPFAFSFCLFYLFILLLIVFYGGMSFCLLSFHFTIFYNNKGLFSQAQIHYARIQSPNYSGPRTNHPPP